MAKGKKVRVAIIGVGNCASALVQGVHFYKDAPVGKSVPGLMGRIELGQTHLLRPLECHRLSVVVCDFPYWHVAVERDLQQGSRRRAEREIESLRPRLPQAG